MLNFLIKISLFFVLTISMVFADTPKKCAILMSPNDYPYELVVYYKSCLTNPNQSVVCGAIQKIYVNARNNFLKMYLDDNEFIVITRAIAYAIDGNDKVLAQSDYKVSNNPEKSLCLATSNTITEFNLYSLDDGVWPDAVMGCKANIAY